MLTANTINWSHKIVEYELNCARAPVFKRRKEKLVWENYDQKNYVKLILRHHKHMFYLISTISGLVNTQVKTVVLKSVEKFMLWKKLVSNLS